VEAENMLEVKQLSVAVGGREILNDINLNIKAGETHVLCYSQRFSEGGYRRTATGA